MNTIKDELIPEEWLNFNDFKKLYENVPVEEHFNNVNKEIASPKVSVQIITYQHKNFISDAIEGVLMQKTDFPFEVIIGDDDSKDGTREICQEYANAFPDKIKLLKHKRENNLKILEKPTHIFQYIYNNFSARGNYIAICSGDDYWTDPCKLKKQYETLISNNKVNLTFTYSKLFLVDENRFIDNEEEAYRIQDPSSWMFENFYLKGVPTELTEIIAEDSFTRHLLLIFGEAVLVKDVNPNVIRIHSSNMYKGTNSKKILQQQINTKEKRIDAFNHSFLLNKKGKDILIGSLISKNQKIGKLKDQKWHEIQVNILKEAIKRNIFHIYIFVSIKRLIKNISIK